MIRKADYDLGHAELTDEQADRIFRDYLHGEPELRDAIFASLEFDAPDSPPIDGAAGDDELECVDCRPKGYTHIDGSEASPWSGPGIALAIVVFGTVWMILREVVQ